MSSIVNFIKRISVAAWVGIAVAVAAAVVMFIYLSRPKPKTAELPVVATMPVHKQDVSIYSEFAGRIRAQQFVEVRARVRSEERRVGKECGSEWWVRGGGGAW